MRVEWPPPPCLVQQLPPPRAGECRWNLLGRTLVPQRKLHRLPQQPRQIWQVVRLVQPRVEVVESTPMEQLVA